MLRLIAMAFAGFLLGALGTAPLPPNPWIASAVALSAAAAATLLRRHSIGRGLPVLVASAAAVMGFWHVHSIPESMSPEPVEIGLTTILGVVVERGHLREFPGQAPRRDVVIEAVDDRGNELGPVRVRGAARDAPVRGERIEATGWLEVDRRGATLRLEAAPTVIGGTGWGWRGTVDRVRDRASRTLRRRLSPRSAALTRALLLGERPPALDAETLRKAGAMHLFAVSGLHLGLLAALITRLLASARLRPWMHDAVLLSILGGYALLTGGRPPVSRAFLMIALVVLGRRTGRPSAGSWTILAVAVASILVAPQLARDVGFLLSFLAVAGLIWIGAPLVREDPPDDSIDRFVRRHRGARPLRRVMAAVWMSWCAVTTTAIVTLPVFGTVTPASVVSNIVLLPAVVALIVGGVLTLVTPWAGVLVELTSAITDLALSQLIEIPFGQVNAAPPAAGALVTQATMLLGAALILGSTRSRRLRLVAAVLPTIGLATALLWSAPCPPPGLEIVDVGQGSCALLDTGRRLVVIDAGSSSRGDAGLRPIRRAILARRGGIDVLVLSHADADHTGAVPGLLDLFRPELIILPDGFESDARGASIATELRARGLDVLSVSSGDTLDIGDGRLEFLAPDSTLAESASRNDRSCVILATVRDHRFLLTGDIEEVGCAALLRGPLPVVDGLVLPHHGADCGLLEPLLRRTRPDRIGVSARRGFSSRETLELCVRQGTPATGTWTAGSIRWAIEN